jgi:hypothetical protein
MQQENNINTIICPFCKSENPDISTCLTCGGKIKREKLNPKDFISRPVFVTILAILSFWGFVKNGFAIYDAKHASTIPILVVFAIVDIFMAYGLWQLKSWARLVTIFNCWLSIVVICLIPILLSLSHEEIRHFFEMLSVDISKNPFFSRNSIMREIVFRGALYRAIIWSIIYMLILRYFYSKHIRKIFSDNPKIWIGD